MCAAEESGARTWLGRRDRPREKSGPGKKVRALTRMFVMVSSRARWGLNWYLCLGGASCQHLAMENSGLACKWNAATRLSDRANNKLQWGSDSSSIPRVIGNVCGTDHHAAAAVAMGKKTCVGRTYSLSRARFA